MIDYSETIRKLREELDRITTAISRLTLSSSSTDLTQTEEFHFRTWCCSIFNLLRRDGDEILKKLRAGERCSQTPVIILTGSDWPQDRANAQKNAVLEYFRKPADLERL